MTDLIPPGSPVATLTIPPGDVQLADGRRLRRGSSVFGEPYPGEEQEMVTFHAPNKMHVLASLDEPRPHGLLLHVSVSYPGHLPSWKDMRLVKEAFFGPEVDAMMLLPAAVDYVNAHSFCLHLWQCPVTWGIR